MKKYPYDDLGSGLFDRGMRAAVSIPRRALEIVIMVTFAVGIIYLFAEKSPYYAVGAVVVLFAILMLLRQPVTLSYALVFMLPLYWINLLGRSLRVITVLTIMALVYHVSRMVVERKLPRYNRVYLAYALYLLTCFLSLFNSIDVERSFLGIKYFLLSLAILVVLAYSITNVRQLRIVVWIIIGWGVAESLLGMLQTFVSVKFFPAYYFQTFGMPIIEAYSVGGVRRASGTYQVGPRYAMFLMAPMAIVVAGFLSNRILSKRAWLALLAPFVIGIFVSLTRIAIVLTFIYAALFNYFESRRQAFVVTIAGLLVLGVLVTGVVFLIIPGQVRNALEQRFSDEGEDIYMDRLYFLWNALGAWTENPILGIGVGTYEIRSVDFMEKYPVPWRQLRWDVAAHRIMPETVPVHNEYGRMLAEQGIFSIPIFLLLLWFTYRNLQYARKNSQDSFIQLVSVGTMIYLATMAVYWYFHEYFLEEPYVSIIPFMLSIIVYNLVRKEVEERDAKGA